ncbi:MAG: hypothetical protein MUC65_08785 [Pontiellaceae bacterium]|jgi:hypothetical protein|nr:hypothetical protein [Pontiellaceae bacterium]
MKNGSVSAFALLIISLLACSCAPITIRTAPGKADVYKHDGTTRLGTTPYYTSIIKRGKAFVIRKDGYEENKVTIYADSPRYVDIRLPRIEPTVLGSQPPGATVYEADGERLIGKTPFMTDVTESDQSYKLKLHGFYDQDVQVTLESPSSMVVPMNPRPINVTLNSTPAGAEVYKTGDRIPLGRTPLKTEVSAQTMYELKADKYYPAAVVLSTQSGTETNVSLQRMPYITINSLPEGAELYLEGSREKSLGTTPITRLIESPVFFELRKTGYDAEPFTLSADSPSSVTVELKEIPYVTIKSRPAGARLYRKGGVELIGETPVKELIRQPKEFELHLEGYVPKCFEISGKDREVTVDMQGSETVMTEHRQPVLK